MNECGAHHPTEDDVVCTEPPGPNAHTPDIDTLWDENGDVVEPAQQGREVHVHTGIGASGRHRWEDVPA